MSLYISRKYKNEVLEKCRNTEDELCSVVLQGESWHPSQAEDEVRKMYDAWEKVSRKSHFLKTNYSGSLRRFVIKYDKDNESCRGEFRILALLKKNEKTERQEQKVSEYLNWYCSWVKASGNFEDISVEFAFCQKDDYADSIRKFFEGEDFEKTPEEEWNMAVSYAVSKRRRFAESGKLKREKDS